MFLLCSLVDELVVFKIQCEKSVPFVWAFTFRIDALVLGFFVFLLGHQSFLESLELAKIYLLVLVQ